MSSLSFSLLITILVLLEWLTKIFFLFMSSFFTNDFINPTFNYINDSSIEDLWYSFFFQVVFVIIIVFNKKIKTLLFFRHNSVALIFSGMLSNTIEGLFFRRVFDFLKIETEEKYFIFNFADVFIWFGVLWFSIRMINYHFFKNNKNL